MLPEIFCTLAVITCTPELETKLVKHEIIRQAQEYNVDVDTALRVANCESSFNRFAKNPNSSAKGVYQFLDGTWEWIRAKGNQFNYKENIRQFMIWYPKYPNWWEECK